MDPVHVVFVELHIEASKVFFQVVSTRCLGDGTHLILLKQPPERDLSGRATVLFRDFSQGRVPQHFPVGKWAVSHESHVPSAQRLEQMVLREKWVILDLITHHGRHLDGLVEPRWREVAHPDMTYAPSISELEHCTEGFTERHVFIGPVNQK